MTKAKPTIMFKVKRRRSKTTSSSRLSGSSVGSSKDSDECSSQQSSIVLKSCLVRSAGAANAPTTVTGAGAAVATAADWNAASCNQSQNSNDTSNQGSRGSMRSGGGCGGNSGGVACDGSKGSNTANSTSANTGGTNPSSSIKRRRSVRFKHVQVREFERVLGDNPSCSSGAPISIGWAHGKDRLMPLDEYESARPERRTQPELVLTRQDREEILIEWGATFNEIIDSIRTNVKIKNQRRRTVNTIGKYEGWEEAMERASRKLKRTLLLQKPVSKRAEDLYQQSERLQKLHPQYTYVTVPHPVIVHHNRVDGEAVNGDTVGMDPTACGSEAGGTGDGGEGGSSSDRTPQQRGAPQSSNLVTLSNTNGLVQIQRRVPVAVAVTEPNDPAGDELRNMGLAPGGENGDSPTDTGGPTSDPASGKQQQNGSAVILISDNDPDPNAPVKEVGVIEGFGTDDDWCATSTLANDDIDGDDMDDEDEDGFVIDQQFGDHYYDDYADLVMGVPPTVTYPVNSMHNILGGNITIYDMVDMVGGGGANYYGHQPSGMELVAMQSLSPQQQDQLQQQPPRSAPITIQATSSSDNMVPVVISEDGSHMYTLLPYADYPGGSGSSPSYNGQGFAMQPPPHSNNIISKWE